MIAGWMLYCALCALGLALAAALAERTLLAGRAPVRLVWVGAVALSLLLPAAVFRFARVTDPAVPAASSSGADHVGTSTSEDAVAAAPMAARNVEHGRTWRTTLSRYDTPLAIVWATLSFAVAFNLFAGVVALAWLRRRWRRQTVLGVSVYVSERTGPAVVGAFAPAIVLPEWVLGLDPSQLALMLRHEQEHQRAGDGRLLTAAQLALIVMPWNLAIWWQILRLRVAVEMDCDARVLRNADARRYGDLLLEVARPRLRPGFVGATAFAERATQLERRIRVLGRHRTNTTRTARALVTAITLVVVSVAWIAPHPAAPLPAPAVITTSQRDTVPPLPSPAPNVVPPAAPAPPPRAPKLRLAKPKPPGVSVVAPSCGQARRSPDSLRTVDIIFDRLFDGITLSAGQAARACDMLERLQQEQVAADEANRQAAQAIQPKLAGLRIQRDSALRALLTTDADRMAFDAHLAPRVGGGRRGGGGGDAGRGRSGGPPPDGVRLLDRPGGRGDGARQGGGGRGGREGGGPADALMASMTDLVTGMTMLALFDGIALTPEQDSRARDLIVTTQREIQAQRPRLDVRLRMNPATGVVSMRAPQDSALASLLPNDADRAMLRSRIVTVPR